MSYNGRNSLEKLNYRQIQRISKNLKLPSNYKKQQLVDIVYARMEGAESEVERLIEIARKERSKAAKKRKENIQRIQAREISSTIGSSISPTPMPSVVIDHRPNAELRYPRRDRIAATPFKSIQMPIRKHRPKNRCDLTNSLLRDTMSCDNFVRGRIQFPIYNKFGVNVKRSRQNIENEPLSTVDCIAKRKSVLRDLLQPTSRGNDRSLVMTRYLNVAKHTDSELTIATQLKAGLSTSLNRETFEGPIDYTKKTSSDDNEKTNCDTNPRLPQSPTYNKSKKAYYENRNMFEKTYIRYRSYKQDFDKVIFLYRRKIHGFMLPQEENNNDTDMNLNQPDGENDMLINNISSYSIHGSNNILDNHFDTNIPAESIYRDDVYMPQMDNLASSISCDQTHHILEVQRNEPDYLIQELGEERNTARLNHINNVEVANFCKDIEMDNNSLLMADETSKDYTEDNINVYYHKKMRAKMLLKERSQNLNNCEESSTVFNATEGNTTSLPPITQAFSHFVPQNYYENGIENIDNSLPLDIGMIVETYNRNTDNCTEPVYSFKNDMVAYPVVPTQDDFQETVTSRNYKQECISPPLAHQNIEPTNNIYAYDASVNFNNMVPNLEYPSNSPHDGDQDATQNRFIGNNNQVSYPLIYEYLQSSEKEVLLKTGVVADNNSSYNTSLEDLASQIEDIDESDSSNNAPDLDLLQYSDTNLGASVTVPDLDENALSFIYEEAAYTSNNEGFLSASRGTEVCEDFECCFCDWTGHIFNFESHIRQEHQTEVSEVHTPEFEQQLSLGTLIDWPSSVLTTVLEYKSQLLLLRVKYENPDFILASLSIIPPRCKDESLFNMVSISVFNKVTGEPFSWNGELFQLHSNQSFQFADTFLRIKISQLDLLPNSANIILLNGKLVPLSPSKAVICGQMHLNDIIIKLNFLLYRNS